MGLFSALGKRVLRYANDKNAERQRKKAKDVAFSNTREKLEEAKETGFYISGKKTYKAELAKENARIDAQHRRNEKTIDDL